jgi:hypothetical protein
MHLLELVEKFVVGGGGGLTQIYCYALVQTFFFQA